MQRVQAIAGAEADSVLLYLRSVEPLQKYARTLHGDVKSTGIFWCEVDPRHLDLTGNEFETQLNRASSAFGRMQNALLSKGDYDTQELCQNFKLVSITKGVEANARGHTSLTGRLQREFLVVVLDAQGRVLRFQHSGRPPVDPEHRWRIGMSGPPLPDNLKDVTFLVEQRTAAAHYRGQHHPGWALHVSALECDAKLLSHVAELRTTRMEEEEREASEEEKRATQLCEWRLEAAELEQPCVDWDLLVVRTGKTGGSLPFDAKRLRKVEEQAARLGFDIMYTTPRPIYDAWLKTIGKDGRLGGGLLMVGDDGLQWPASTYKLHWSTLANSRTLVTASGLDELFTTWNRERRWILDDVDFKQRRAVYLKNKAAEGLTVPQCIGAGISLVVLNPRFAPPPPPPSPPKKLNLGGRPRRGAAARHKVGAGGTPK